MMPSTLTSKLQLKPGQTMTLMNPPEGYSARLESELEGVELGDAKEPDAVLAFIASLAQADKFAPRVFRTVTKGGLAWIAYPKSSSLVETDVNRDILWEALKPTGWRPVRQVSLDDTWSAIRFRPEEEVGT